jgi:hypothetical protein
MTIASYSDLQAAVGNWLDHSLFAARVPEFIALFEAAANRRLRVRQQEATALLYPSNPLPIAITGAANNGSGLVRLTVASTATIVSGAEMNVANVGGTTEANGSWLVTVIDATHVDLVGSAFANPYVAGGTIQGQAGQAALPSDYLAWRRVTWTGQTRNELQFVHPSYLQAAFPTMPADVPRIFTIEGKTLKIMPLDATPLELDYFAKVPALASIAPQDGSQANWLLTEHPDLYLFGSLVEAEMFGVNDERAPVWKARRDEIFDEIEKLNNKTRGPSAVRVMGATP